MSNLYLMAHKSSWFGTDFIVCGTHVIKQSCQVCGVNLNRLVSPLLYEWEYEFGNPIKSVERKYQCFWGGLLPLVTNSGMQTLRELDLDLKFSSSKFRPVDLDGKKAKPLEGGPTRLFWMRVKYLVDAHGSNPNTICEKCGNFVKNVRQIRKLRVARLAIPKTGIFSIRQNGPDSPIFVTESARKAISSSGIKGIGFYLAGSIVR